MPRPRQYEAKLIGFALVTCKLCYGTGRLGFLSPAEQGIVQQCPCVVTFEASKLKEEAAANAAKQQQQSDSSAPPPQQREGDPLPSEP